MASGQELVTERFARLFNPLGHSGESELILYAGQELRGNSLSEDAFRLCDTASLSRHAVARAMFWLGYKGGVLSGAEAQGRKCLFAGEAHERCEGDKDSGYPCLRVMDQYIGGTAPALDKVVGPESVYASWVRCRWLEVYYRARQIREHRGAESEKLLGELAIKYAQAVKVTRSFFPQAIASTGLDDCEVRIDWRWLYLWSLANVTVIRSRRMSPVVSL